MVAYAELLLTFMRLVLFGLALMLTIISFQAYTERQTKQLESAFIGFAFISMGVALTTLGTQVTTQETLFQVVETVPFIVGFAMLLLSLNR